MSAGAERKNDVGKRGVSPLSVCFGWCMHGEVSPVAVKSKTRHARVLLCLQRPIALQGVITNVGEERDHIDGHSDEGHLTEGFFVDAMRQTFPRRRLDTGKSVLGLYSYNVRGVHSHFPFSVRCSTTKGVTNGRTIVHCARRDKGQRAG